MEACRWGHHECARALINANAAVDTVDDVGTTALLGACSSGHHECARALINANAAVDTVNNYGYTPLMEACNLCHLECARALIEAGAAVDMVNNDGWTALLLACKTGSYECTRALIDAQADLELTNRVGQNALMMACESPPSYYELRLRRNRIRCAFALLEATALIQETDFPDRASLLRFACGRLQLIEVALASKHVIEDAPPLANVGALKTDAQDIVVNFAHDMLARANPVAGLQPSAE